MNLRLVYFIGFCSSSIKPYAEETEEIIYVELTRPIVRVNFDFSFTGFPKLSIANFNSHFILCFQYYLYSTICTECQVLQTIKRSAHKLNLLCSSNLIQLQPVFLIERLSLLMDCRFIVRLKYRKKIINKVLVTSKVLFGVFYNLSVIFLCTLLV